ncbi:MAG: glutamate synthase subunit alpha, partial [Leucobacter sp.]|nr:glutamate synthase subunit alpha [Leucobacter sp.]
MHTNYAPNPSGRAGEHARTPARIGLYDPAEERDACGLAAVVSLNAEPAHEIVRLALEALENLEHRGAVGSDAGTGDGAGILCEIPDAWLRASVEELLPEVRLPGAGGYVTGLAFLPQNTAERRAVRYRIAAIAAEEGLDVLGWRPVATRPEVLGEAAREAGPAIEQPILVPLGAASALESPAGLPLGPDGGDLERRAFRTRKRVERETGTYLPSLSSRTIVFKGMVTTPQLAAFYPELRDERFAARFAIVHSRYSTNTFPSWHLAQPLRM